MKQIVLGFFMFFVPLIASSQTMAVSSFKVLESDLTAYTYGTQVLDMNGQKAALIKVVTSQTGFFFDADEVGIIKVKQTPGEVWVYIPRGAKRITIKHPQLGVLRDYNFPVKIESARTYEMVLATNEANQGGEYATNAKVLSAEEANKRGVEYYNKENYAEAVKWFRKAADQGYARGLYNLGVLYENGQGVTKNYQTAKEWYQKALNKDPNYTKAKENLANVEKKIAEQSSSNNYALNSKPATKNNDTPRQQTVSTTIMMPDVDKDIPLTTVKNPNILAVIIGNEKYSKLPDVPYAENDAKMFKEYCEKTLGVTEGHIKYLPNAGFVDIYDAVEWLKTGTGSYGGDASVIFYYAGHGLPDPKTGFQYILPADVDGKNLNLTVSLQKLYDEFGEMPARSVAVFLDACFSGTNRDNNMVAANSGARLALTKSKIGTPKGKTVIFSATEDDQTAHPFKDRKHGFFTYFLLRKLQESKGTATLGEIADYVTKSVKRAVFDEIQVSQTPSVKPSGNFANDWRHMKLK